jgi:4-hydroxybenzoate polyprenyltransferase
MDFVALFTLLYTILWLTVGANIFLYAQNDAFDTESDIDNPKKTDFEYRAVTSEKKSLLSLSYIFLCAYIPILFFIPSVTVYVFTVWVLIVVTYNTPPLRLKAVPLLDCIFSFNFPLWGVFGYSLVTGALPSFTYLVFLGAFSILCHIYTAIGDIEYDKKSSVYTTAVLFKSERNNILICIFGMMALVIYMYVLLPPTEKLYVLPLTLYVLFFISHAIYEHFNKGGATMHIWYSWFIKLHYIVGFLFTLILMY